MKPNTEALAQMTGDKTTRARKYSNGEEPTPKTTRPKRFDVSTPQGEADLKADFTAKKAAIKAAKPTREEVTTGVVKDLANLMQKNADKEEAAAEKPARKPRRSTTLNPVSQPRKPVTIASLEREAERAEAAAVKAKDRVKTFAHRENVASALASIKAAQREVADAQRTIANNEKLLDKLQVRYEKLLASNDATA